MTTERDDLMAVSRRAVVAGMASMALPACTRRAVSGPFPSHPLRMMVPFAPGGPTDLVGRLVSSQIESHWHQPVVVDNRPGASGTIGSEQVLQRGPDGYTLCLGNNASHASYEVLHPQMAPYVTLRDFAPVALVGFTQTIMAINPLVPAHTLQEFVAYVKQHPGDINYGSPAFGSAPHLACELLNQKAGIQMQLVNYNGASPTMLALTAGEIQVYMGGASSVKGMIKAGKVRGIAVMSADRAPELPDLPTAAEAGYPDVTWDSWYGIFEAARVPLARLDELNAVINAGMGGPDVLEKLSRFGLRRKLGSRDDFRKVVERELALTKRVAQAAGIGVGGQ